MKAKATMSKNVMSFDDGTDFLKLVKDTADVFKFSVKPMHRGKVIGDDKVRMEWPFKFAKDPCSLTNGLKFTNKNAVEGKTGP